MKLQLSRKILSAERSLKFQTKKSILYEPRYDDLFELFVERVKVVKTIEELIKLNEWHMGWVDNSMLHKNGNIICYKCNDICADLRFQLSEATDSEVAYRLFVELSMAGVYFSFMSVKYAKELYEEAMRRIGD